MEYFSIQDKIGFRSYKNNHIVQVEINSEQTLIIIYVDELLLEIDRKYIVSNITPNFNVEMLYYVLSSFIKYDNYRLIENNSKDGYIFEGYYNEPYEQGDNIHIKIEIR
jgi:hypothetical protein